MNRYLRGYNCSVAGNSGRQSMDERRTNEIRLLFVSGPAASIAWLLPFFFFGFFVSFCETFYPSMAVYDHNYLYMYLWPGPLSIRWRFSRLRVIVGEDIADLRLHT
jgi:hypothetical protein